MRLPIRGLAGAVINSNNVINIADAYTDHRFDDTMDRRTGYRTRQVLGVPLRNPLNSDCMGLLQVNNRLDNEEEAFTNEQMQILQLAAEQLSELLLGRADVFIHGGGSMGAGGNGGHMSLGQGAGDGVSIVNSHTIQRVFTIDITSVTLGQKVMDMLKAGELVGTLEVTLSPFMALTPLCPPRAISMEVPPMKKGSATNTYTVSLRERVTFNELEVKDAPRACRILVQIGGRKKKGGELINLGYASCLLFDFKGCLDPAHSLNFFWINREEGGASAVVPVSTSLSNDGDTSVGGATLLLSPDLLDPSLSDEDAPPLLSFTPRVRIVHTLPPTPTPPVNTDPDSLPSESMASYESLSVSIQNELTRIMHLSYKPVHELSEGDKELLWGVRYSMVSRGDLLPSLIMATDFSNAENVKELYTLLDLWSPLNLVTALTLLDRRYMDSKVRAYAVHCLEDVPDEELALYMLQLTQQLKFEYYVDSALARFLLRRALTNSKLIGHIFFWLLQSEVYNLSIRKRYIILLQVTFASFSSILSLYVRLPICVLCILGVCEKRQ
ncbi:GAF domain-containing protein [archaeon]|nr:MAG: GAF domain-containing protein [archaeon]